MWLTAEWMDYWLDVHEGKYKPPSLIITDLRDPHFVHHVGWRDGRVVMEIYEAA